ncbi:MAG: MerR family transcriptional regulator [Candidatus Sumerlaeaceae bacterium]|nr:MerR family transcriptional regulator [Candidatus Sumerlaeaceae bacterium]
MSSHGTRLVPIRTVCAMYNLNPNTLRTWERRYGIIKPKRSAGGHRVFDQADLANIETMLRLMGNGLSPAEAAEQTRKPAAGAKPQPAVTQLQPAARQLRAALTALDAQASMKACRDALRTAGYERAVEDIFFPELAYWGQRWEVKPGTGSIAHEHLASLCIRAILLDRQQALMPRAAGPFVTLACAPGEEHDLPLLHAANLILASRVLRPLLLVSGLPIAEIADASRRVSAAAIVLAATLQPRPAVLRGWIDELIAAGWEERTVLVGPGFTRSRIFSETRVKAVTGGYAQVLAVLRRMLDL